MRTVIPKRARLIPEQADLVFQGIVFDVYQWQQEMFDGSHKTFEMLLRPDTVEIIAVRNGEIVTIEQEQPSFGRYYDLPSGRKDIPDEDELQTAKREMLEETGMSFRTWRLVAIKQPIIKIDWLVYTFLATDFEGEIGQHLDGGEKISINMHKFEEAKQLLTSEKSHYCPEVIRNATSLEELMDLPTFSD